MENVNTVCMKQNFDVVAKQINVLNNNTVYGLYLDIFYQLELHVYQRSLTKS